MKSCNLKDLKIHTSHPPKGSPLAASKPADMIVMSGANSLAEVENVTDRKSVV